jgi:hypothetical protein
MTCATHLFQPRVLPKELWDCNNELQFLPFQHDFFIFPTRFFQGDSSEMTGWDFELVCWRPRWPEAFVCHDGIILLFVLLLFRFLSYFSSSMFSNVAGAAQHDCPLFPRGVPQLSAAAQ